MAGITEMMGRDLWEEYTEIALLKVGLRAESY
jgi:hypothetical protein